MKRIAAVLMAGLLLLPGAAAFAAERGMSASSDNIRLATALPKPAPESQRMLLTAATQAAQLYAFGLQQRNASIQYALFSKDYKKVMYPRFTELNWVTGVSSPWIIKWEMTKETVIDNNTKDVEIRLDTATSSGPEASVLLTVTLIWQKHSWVINEVTSDRELPRSGILVK